MTKEKQEFTEGISEHMKGKEIIDIEDYKEEDINNEITENDFNKLDQFGIIGEYIKKLILDVMKFTNNIKQNEKKLLENKKEIKNAKEIAEASKNVNTDAKVYFNQTEIGNSYKPTLSRNAVGNILRIVNLAYKNPPTRPKRNEAVEPGIAKMAGDYFKWERSKVNVKWNNWLKEHDLWNEWNKHSEPTERRLFVKKLHKEYVE